MTNANAKDFRVGNKVVGTLKDGRFVKAVDYQKHHLHKYKAWAIDKAVFLELKKAGCTDFIIKEKKGNRAWTIPFYYFENHAFEINHGYGDQIACADCWWYEKDMKQVEMF